MSQRTPGLHLSDVIKALAGGMNESNEGEAYNEATRMQFEKGWLWEDTLSTAYRERMATRVDELEYDGIVCSPDGLSFDDAGNPVVEEYKCTSANPAKRPTDNWRWMMQAKGYCKVTGAVKCVFRVLHLMYVPVYRVWEITFTQGEIEENWSAIRAQAELMKG